MIIFLFFFPSKVEVPYVDLILSSWFLAMKLDVGGSKNELPNESEKFYVATIL